MPAKKKVTAKSRKTVRNIKGKTGRTLEPQEKRVAFDAATEDRIILLGEYISEGREQLERIESEVVAGSSIFSRNPQDDEPTAKEKARVRALLRHCTAANRCLEELTHVIGGSIRAILRAADNATHLDDLIKVFTSWDQRSQRIYSGSEAVTGPDELGIPTTALSDQTFFVKVAPRVLELVEEAGRRFDSPETNHDGEMGAVDLLKAGIAAYGFKHAMPHPNERGPRPVVALAEPSNEDGMLGQDAKPADPDIG